MNLLQKVPTYLSEMSPDTKTPTKSPKKVACCVHFCLYLSSHIKLKSYGKQKEIGCKFLKLKKLSFFLMGIFQAFHCHLSF